MSNRDFGVVALGRFLAVERYRESHQWSSTSQPRSAGAYRTGGQASNSGSRGGSRAAARPPRG